MSSFITQITEEELTQKTTFTKGLSSISFENGSFKKGPTFSLGMREQALTYCNKISNAQSLKSLIVEGKYSLTIWIQEKLEAIQAQSEQKNSSSAENTEEIDDLPTTTAVRHYRGQTYEIEVVDETALTSEQKDTVKAVPTKKVIRQYRGQTYEVEVPDYSAMQQASQNQQKPRRKYRGQYID